MVSLIGILVFLNWAPSAGSSSGWDLIYRWKYSITGAFAAILLYSLIRWFSRRELKEWTLATRDFAAQILPLLVIGCELGLKRTIVYAVIVVIMSTVAGMLYGVL